MEKIIDARYFVSKQEAHSVLRSALGEENYIGSNLDALHDCLTSICIPTEIRIINWSHAMYHLKAYANILWHVLDDSSEENPCLHITID